MALSKLAISLIAGIGSVVTVGGITAGVVVSRQNATQTMDSSNDEFNEPIRTEDNSNKTVSTNSSNKAERNSTVANSMVADDPKASNSQNAEDKLKELQAKKDKEKENKEQSGDQTFLSPTQSGSDLKPQEKKREEGVGNEDASGKGPKQAEAGNEGEQGEKDKPGTPMSSNVVTTETAGGEEKASLEPTMLQAEVDEDMQP